MEQVPQSVDPRAVDGSGSASGSGVCAVHGLATGPDGQCVLCRRTAAPDSGRARLVWGGMVGLLVLGALCATLYFFLLRQKKHAPSPRASQSSAPVETEADTDDPDEDLRELARLRRLSDARRRAKEAGQKGGWATTARRPAAPVKPPPMVRPPPMISAAQRRLQLQRQAQADLQAAMGQVSITAYLADW